jgi:hypothetical protein
VWVLVGALGGCYANEEALGEGEGGGYSATTVGELTVGGHYCPTRGEIAVRTIPGVQHRFDRVAELIEGFETPYGMELLATVHAVAKEDSAARSDPDAALRAVRAWSERKRSTMRPSHVRVAWERLRQHGWLAQA